MLFDDKEPTWFNRKTNNLIKYKNEIYKGTPDRKNNINFQFQCRYIQDFINKKIDQAKRKFQENMSSKLPDESFNPKKYWFLLKALINGQKILYIPPLYYNNKFISEIKEKGEFCHSYFAGQSTPIVNNSQFSTRFITHFNSVLMSTDFSVEQVNNII